MTQFPNDPGPDRQENISYQPKDTFSVLNEQTFIDAMEMQTKYSYECSKQLSDLAFQKASDLVDKLKENLSQTNANLEDAINDITDLQQAMDLLQNVNNEQDRKLEMLHRMVTIHMDSLDHANLVNRVLGRC